MKMEEVYTAEWAKSVKRYQELTKGRGSNYERLAFIEANQAEWVEVEGVEVLRIKNSKFVAVPVTGRKSSARFDIVDLTDRSDIVCQLTKKEVRGWLFGRYENEVKG